MLLVTAVSFRTPPNIVLVNVPVHPYFTLHEIFFLFRNHLHFSSAPTHPLAR